MDRWKISAVVGWGVVAVGLLAGAAGKGELRAKRLVIEDERGRDRIVMGVSKGGYTSMTFFDAKGKERMAVELSKAGEPSITMSDRKDDLRLIAGVSDGGFPDKDKDEGEPGVTLFGKKGAKNTRLEPDGVKDAPPVPEPFR